MADFPVSGHDKHGPYIKRGIVDAVIAREIATDPDDNAITRKAKHMDKEIKKATESVNETLEVFGRALDRLNAAESRITDSAKRSSGNLRDSAQKLADGMSRIEKVANFDRLERMVSLLERAASAMGALALLEESGKLSKIAESLK